MPHKLLLADDSVTIQRVIELTFADEDVQVIAVGDGQEGDREHPGAIGPTSCWPTSACRSATATRWRRSSRAIRELAHIPGPAADGRVRADRRDARARGRVRRRARQAVRAADGDQPREGPARRPPARRVVGAPARRRRRRRRPAGDPARPGVASRAPAAAGGSLEDYFDRLDAAFASLDAASRRARGAARRTARRRSIARPRSVALRRLRRRPGPAPRQAPALGRLAAGRSARLGSRSGRRSEDPRRSSPRRSRSSRRARPRPAHRARRSTPRRRSALRLRAALRAAARLRPRRLAAAGSGAGSAASGAGCRVAAPLQPRARADAVARRSVRDAAVRRTGPAHRAVGDCARRS